MASMANWHPKVSPSATTSHPGSALPKHLTVGTQLGNSSNPEPLLCCTLHGGDPKAHATKSKDRWKRRNTEWLKIQLGHGGWAPRWKGRNSWATLRSHQSRSLGDIGATTLTRWCSCTASEANCGRLGKAPATVPVVQSFPIRGVETYFP